MPASEELVADQIVLVVDHYRLVIISILGIHHGGREPFVEILMVLYDSLRSASLRRIGLLQNGLVLLCVLGLLPPRLLPLFLAHISRVPLGPDLHDTSLGSAANCYALAVVGSVFLREDILEYRQLVIINVEQVVLFVVIVVKVYNAEVIGGAGLVSSLSIVMYVVVVGCLI